MTPLRLIGLASLIFVEPPALSADWFYGHPAPKVSAAAAYSDWVTCLSEAIIQLDDGISSAMDVATAVEPICGAKEEVMIDAINMEFLDKNRGIAGNMSLTAMEETRQYARGNFRQTIGTLVLKHRKNKK